MNQSIIDNALREIEMNLRGGRADESLEIGMVGGSTSRRSFARRLEVEPKISTWVRYDFGAKAFRTTGSWGGPPWHKVVRRISEADGQVIEDFQVREMRSEDLHKLLPKPAKVLVTTLFYEAEEESERYKVDNWADASEEEETGR